MDLTKIDNPFGELDDATKGALLLAAHRGEVIEYYAAGWYDICDPLWTVTTKYRVHPKPVIGEVVLHGVSDANYGNRDLYCQNPFGIKDRTDRLKFTFPTRDGLHVPGVYTSPDGLQIKIEVAE